jgi:hypothetical protein
MKKLAVFTIALMVSGCGELIHNQTVEIVRVLAAAEQANVKALTDALVKAQATSCAVPR